MATEKIINTRIQLKYDSYENWSKSTVTLKSGEMAIAYLGPTHTTTAPDNGSHPVLFKVGPGKFNELPWASALAADVYAWAKKEHLDVNDLPTLPLTVVDTEEGKFVTDIEYANDTITIHRGSVAWNDIQDKPNLVNSVKATDDDVVILAPETAASGDVTITGAHKKYNKAGSTTDANSDATTAGASVTIKVPTLTVDVYGHTEFNGETSHTITIPNEVAVGDGNITIAAGAGLATGGTFNVNQDTDATITLDHADTSNVADVVAADRTYVKSLTFDDFGHVTGVDVGTETVTNTAHTHSNGAGTKVSENGGISGDVAVNLNIAMYLDDNQNIVIYDKDDTSKTAIASMPAANFIKDGMLEDVEYSEVTNTLTFTWNTAAGQKVDTVTLSDIIDPYQFEAGALLDVAVEETKVTYSHETIAAPTKSAGSGREYLTGVTTDGYGHITGFTTASEVDQDLSGKKDVQTPVADPTANGSTLAFIDSISQNANGEITVTKKNVDFTDINDKLNKKLDANGWRTDEEGALYAPNDMTHITGERIEIRTSGGTSTTITDTSLSIFDEGCSIDLVPKEHISISDASDKSIKLTTEALLVHREEQISMDEIEKRDYTLTLPEETGTLLTNASKISADQFKATAASAGAATEEVWVFNCGSSTFLVD